MVGSGIRNALVLSDRAAGFPHLFLRTAKPVDVGVGMFRARWILGGLTESLYFDEDPSNGIARGAGWCSPSPRPSSRI